MSPHAVLPMGNILFREGQASRSVSVVCTEQVKLSLRNEFHNQTGACDAGHIQTSVVALCLWGLEQTARGHKQIFGTKKTAKPLVETLR